MPTLSGNDYGITIKINNTAVEKIKAEWSEAIVYMSVESDMYRPSEFILTFNSNNDLDLIDSNRWAMGAKVEVSVETTKEGSVTTTKGQIFVGELVAVEPDFSRDAISSLTLRALDKSHRMFRGTRGQAYVNKSDSDIASEIARKNGLQANVDTTTPKFPYVLQANVSDMDFLRSRANRIGYQLWVSDGKLNFKKVDTTQDTTVPEIEWQDQLLEFRPRLSGAQRVSEVQIRDWSAKDQKAIVGKAKAADAVLKYKAGIAKNAGALTSSFGTAIFVATDQSVGDASEADGVAKRLADEINADYIQADGIAFGDPRILAGRTLKVKGVGTKFSGQYFLGRAGHVWEPDRGYRTFFSVSGRHDDSWSTLLNRSGRGADLSRINGVVTGKVTALGTKTDTSGQAPGLIRVKFEWMGDQIVSAWMRVLMPSGGTETGVMFYPEVDDEVLVAFEQGDVNRPFMIGALWNEKQKPPEGFDAVIKNGKILKRVIRSKSGHTITFVDDKGKESITIQEKNKKTEILLDSKAKGMTIKVEKDLTIEAEGMISITSKTKDITLDCNNFTVKTKQKATIDAKGDVAIKGMNTKVDGNMKLDMKGGIGLTLKGGLAQAALQGVSMNINNGALEVM